MPTWVTNDFRKIPLQAMTNGHILNCIDYIQCNHMGRKVCDGFTNHEWVKLFQTELLDRRKMVIDKSV